MQEDHEKLKRESGNLNNLKAQNDNFNSQLRDLNLALEQANMDNNSMAEDLERQKTLYSELKKMRGKEEEMEVMQQYEEVKYRLIELLEL